MSGWARLVHHLRDLPIGFQLAAVYTALLACILLGLGLLVASQFDRFLIENASFRLRTQAEQIMARERRGFPGGPDRRPGPGPGPGASYLERTARGLVSELTARDTHVRVYDASATLILDGPTFSDVPEWPLPDEAALQRCLAGSPQAEIVDYGSSRAVQVILPVTDRSERIGAVALTTSLEGAEELLTNLRLLLILGITAAGVIGALIGIPVTRFLLRPLERVVTTAESISAGDLSRRVGLPPGRNELSRLGAAFDRMVDQIEATLRAQRQFIADSSHELRTPLTALGGMVEMLLLGVDAGDRQKTQRVLSALDREIGRLSRLVQDLLTLSQLDAHPRIARQPVALSRLVEDITDQARGLARGQSVQCTIEPGVAVLGDPDRLQQVILNLMDNALKYTPPDGQVTLTLRRDHDQADLTVADTGEGIAPDALPHIFDRFYRADKARARKSGGAGLGLAIAQAIVEAHGGRLDAASDGIGCGSRFTLRLPLAGAGLSGEHRSEPARAAAIPRGRD
ncbi:MAG TPA: ATP-binding protein [Dehalococcoidia bacterium]|nr:ATP-binding protein [Dehalococcoidia bacterium]